MRRLGTWALFWIALFPLWLLYEGEWDRTEVVAGAAAATIGATAAVVALEVALLRYRFGVCVLARAAKVPWSVVHEFWLITTFLMRHPRGGGQFERFEFAAGRTDPEGRARRASTALLATLSPNSYIVDIDPATGEVLAHTLQPVPGEQVTLE
jgi:multisubunit Na+/H+ antiporter MnhE subunit